MHSIAGPPFTPDVLWSLLEPVTQHNCIYDDIKYEMNDALYEYSPFQYSYDLLIYQLTNL